MSRFEYSSSEESSDETERHHRRHVKRTYKRDKSPRRCRSPERCPERCPAPCPGPKGDRGDRGIKGDPGMRGPQGPIGSVGPKGDKGDKGDRGPQGQPGPQGDMGPMGRPGPEGKRGPMGCQGERGKKGPEGQIGRSGPTGGKGPTGAGGGTILKCIDIRFRGWAGETIIKTPPRDSKDNIQLDVYYLDCKADLFISTGVDMNGAWATINSPETPYFYYQTNGTENLRCPGATGSGSLGNIGSTGTTGSTGIFKKQIWWVVPNPDPSSPLGGTITPLTTYFPDLKEGDKVFDACSGKLYQLVNGSWECCGSFRGDRLNCVDIKYNGFGGISLPRDNQTGASGFYYLDYGGVNSQSNDADLYISTGQAWPNSWTQVDLFPDSQNPVPFFYFEYLNGPDPTATQASIVGTSGATGSNVLSLAGTITGKFSVGQRVTRLDTAGLIGDIVELGTGTGKEGTYILDRIVPVGGPYPVNSSGQIPSFTNFNTGRLWYVEPVPGGTSTRNGKATQYQLLCNLQAGDKVIDSNSGNFYTLFCDADNNCYWTCSPILPCQVVDGTCPSNCGTTGGVDTSVSAPCCNLKGPAGPAGNIGPTGDCGQCLKSGCINYSGRCGESKPSNPYALGVYFLDLSDGDLYQSRIVNSVLTWIPVNLFEPYLYICTDTNLIYNVVPHIDGTSHENGCVFDISSGMTTGTKFIDCCSGNIYTWSGSGWSCVPDFPFGITGATGAGFGCTGTIVPGTTGCCSLGGSESGDTLDCVNILYSGVCQESIDASCPGVTGTFGLDLSTSKLYQSNGLAWMLFAIQPLDYYYLCTQVGCTGAAPPPFSIYHVTSQNISAVRVENFLGLRGGAKILDCPTSTLYELRADGWYICCQIMGSGGGATGGMGPTGPTGGVGPTGAAGPTGALLLDILKLQVSTQAFGQNGWEGAVGISGMSANVYINQIEKTPTEYSTTCIISGRFDVSTSSQTAFGALTLSDAAYTGVKIPPANISTYTTGTTLDAVSVLITVDTDNNGNIKFGINNSTGNPNIQIFFGVTLIW